MADTAIKTDEEKKEYIDPPDVLDYKVQMLADLILESSSMICFTGAGISTATGIKDYRSGKDTILEVGPGAWELAAMRKAANSGAASSTASTASSKNSAASKNTTGAKVSPKSTAKASPKSNTNASRTAAAAKGPANRAFGAAARSPAARVSPKGNAGAAAKPANDPAKRS